ncbi:hypothetical protein E3N88_28033 [Mikania micrantha]|uniref:Chromo domain-containing protein n=1 Tax=Mikania micrantha TaxID=192012 RepID=A0A5N6N1C7_9ASTR|nr:hypothetical protein E3N88_28033 [Mikania micrantha]
MTPPVVENGKKIELFVNNGVGHNFYLNKIVTSSTRSSGKSVRLKLPDELSGVHDVFHVSNLKRCLADESLIIPLKEIQVDEQLHFIEEPVEIMELEVKRLKRSRIPIVKVRWNSKRGPEFTWEREDNMKTKYPHLFKN